MNRKAFNRINYGLFIVAAAADGKRNGCIVNSLHQVTSSSPYKFSLTVNKSNETFYTFLFSALGSLPLSRLWEDASLLLDPRAILGGLGIGVLCCILPYLLYTEGLRWAEPGKAAILATVEPFVAALIGIFAFHEAVTPYKLLGMAAIFGAILILNRRP